MTSSASLTRPTSALTRPQSSNNHTTRDLNYSLDLHTVRTLRSSREPLSKREADSIEDIGEDEDVTSVPVNLRELGDFKIASNPLYTDLTSTSRNLESKIEHVHNQHLNAINHTELHIENDVKEKFYYPMKK